MTFFYKGCTAAESQCKRVQLKLQLMILINLHDARQQDMWHSQNAAERSGYIRRRNMASTSICKHKPKLAVKFRRKMLTEHPKKRCITPPTLIVCKLATNLNLEH